MQIDKRTLSPELERKIANMFFLARFGRALREMWASVLRQELPPSIAALIKDLQAREQAIAVGGRRGEPVATHSSPPRARQRAQTGGGKVARAGGPGGCKRGDPGH